MLPVHWYWLGFFCCMFPCLSFQEALCVSLRRHLPSHLLTDCLLAVGEDVPGALGEGGRCALRIGQYLGHSDHIQCESDRMGITGICAWIWWRIAVRPPWNKISSSWSPSPCRPFTSWCIVLRSTVLYSGKKRERNKCQVCWQGLYVCAVFEMCLDRSSPMHMYFEVVLAWYGYIWTSVLRQELWVWEWARKY